MKRSNRVIEIFVLSTWVLTFFLDYKPELIRAIAVIVGAAVTVPRLYSGIVKRESPSYYPTLDKVALGYQAINVKATEKDLDALSYPGLEGAYDSSILLVSDMEYKSIEVDPSKHYLVVGGKMSDCPTVYIGTEAFKIAKGSVKTSIPCFFVLPNSTRQIPLAI